MKKLPFILFFLIIITESDTVISQTTKTTGIKVSAVVVNGDTIPYLELSVVKIYGQRIFARNKDKRRWDKLVRNVKKVYPLAKIAGSKMKEYEKSITNIKDEKSKKIYLKKSEETLKAQFEKDIRNLTYSQGKVLIKLIDRETGKTSYQIIKDFRGSLQAFFWQTLARIFDNNLKDEYDPIGEDKAIEEIVLKIESGDL